MAKKKPVFLRVRDFLLKNPKGTYQQFKRRTRLTISSQCFEILRRIYLKGGTQTGVTYGEFQKVYRFVQENPKKGYQPFCERYKTNLTAYNFYLIKRVILHGEPYENYYRRRRDVIRGYQEIRSRRKGVSSEKTKQQVEKFLSKDPFGKYKDFIRRYRSATISDAYFYRLRAIFNTHGTCFVDPKPSRVKHVDKGTLIKIFCIKFPDATYSEFMGWSQVEISSEYYYTYRKRLRDKGIIKVTKARLRRVREFLAKARKTEPCLQS